MSQTQENFKVDILAEGFHSSGEFEKKHLNNYFEIIWLKNGKGNHQIDMIDHAYEGSVLFFLAPGQVHELFSSEKTEGYSLKFLASVFRLENDFVDFLFDTCLLDSKKSCPVITVPDHLNDTISELFFRIVEEYTRRLPGADVVLSSYLKILTTHARRIKDSYLSREVHLSKPQYTLFRKFRILVEQHYKTKHSVQDYALMLHTQPRSLNAASRKFADRSALEIIQERIILEAKRKLYLNGVSIKQLGYELGYEDPAYFTRFFRKNVGISPQYFKTAILES